MPLSIKPIGFIEMYAEDSGCPLYSELPLSELAQKNLDELRLALGSKFSDEDKLLALELFLLLDIASKGKRSPRMFQLEGAVSILQGKDTLVRAGTGYGKTLIMTLVMLRDRAATAVTIVPLKSLQHAHVRSI